MRWLVVAMALVIVVIIGNKWSSSAVSGNRAVPSDAVSSYDQTDRSGIAGYGGNEIAPYFTAPDDNAPVVSPNPTVARPAAAEASEKTDSAAFVIGSPKDPDDPASLILDDPEVIIVGEPKDPDDPASLMLSNSEVINVGEPMNPDDPSSLILSDAEVIIVGEPKDPDAGASFYQSDPEVIKIGEPKDPDLQFPRE